MVNLCPPPPGRAAHRPKGSSQDQISYQFSKFRLLISDELEIRKTLSVRVPVLGSHPKNVVNVMAVLKHNNCAFNYVKTERNWGTIIKEELNLYRQLIESYHA